MRTNTAALNSASSALALFALLSLSACGSSGVDGSANSLHGGDAAPLSFDAGSNGGTVSEVGFTIDAGIGTNASDGGCAPNFTGVVRDFHFSHPDFEKFLSDTGEKGAVKNVLGADDKPVWNDAMAHSLFTTQANFDQWYRDTPGVNESMTFDLPVTAISPGVFGYDNEAFFPIDGKLFGDEGVDDSGKPHNYAFTFELHTQFFYKGGEVFTFRGDDDLWVFINRNLAIDLGGTHPALDQTIKLDDLAAELGITIGNTYDLAVFNAERHTTGSHFKMSTSINFTNCTAIIH